MAETKPKLLVIEDDEGLQRQLKWAYEDWDVLAAGNRAEAIALLRSEEPPVATLDLGLPPDPDGTSEGFATLAEMLRLKPDLKVVVASGHGRRESAQSAIAGGAWDFYQKPVDIEELQLIVARAFHVGALERENRRLSEAGPQGAGAFSSIITAAPEMAKTLRTLERVAATQVSVMLQGASGTGKELLAKGVHAASDRADGPFVAINCAAIPETLLEAELFGHEKGAFTGALKTVEGKIELAEGGTLFLDEVGDIPLPLQVKLLRFVQERVIERVGGRRAIPVDVRILTATHRDLAAMIAEETFREDLYYRLAEIVVPIPALSERTGDAALLAKHFLGRFAAEMNARVSGFAPDAIAALEAHGWPGNVRELENRMKRAVIMADGKNIRAADLDLDAPEDDDDREAINLKAVREIADRKAIRRAIARTGGNISGAAKLLGISRPTLYDLLKQYELQT